MDYLQALKKVQASKTKENFMIIEVAYDKKLVMTQKTGIAFIEALNTAEQLKDPYREAHSIVPLDKDTYTVKHLSSDEYEQYKIATLLGLTMEEVKQARLTLSE